MKKLALILSLAVTSGHCMAQGMYGVDVGLGKTTAYNGKFTPRVEAYLMGAVNDFLQLGAGVGMERYSFQYSSGITPAAGSAGDIISIRQKSTYTYVMPKIDAGIGYRQYIHVMASVGAGIFTGGKQVTNQVDAFPSPGVSTYTADHNTSNNLPAIMFRYGGGVSERVPTRGFFSVTLSQEFGYLTKSFYNAAPDLRTGYIAFSVGIAHNYNQIFVEY